ncbi:MAG: PepSY domain-containing protein [Burkholderiales bacterium]|nr:PepSY domain-containing protein [Burkholderiales bacterium]
MPTLATRRDARPHPRLATLHRWLGVGLGLWFALVGLTGALLVWRDDIDAWLNPGLFDAREAGPPLDAERIAELARTQHALGRIERIRLPQAAGGAGAVYRLQLRTAASRVESGRIEAFIAPASGALLGVRSLEALSLAPPHAMRTLYEFHRNILLGEPGSNFVGIAGFLLMSSAISGALLAWPRQWRRLARWQALLAVSWRANVTRVLFDLHRATGALIALVLLLTTATGATLVYLNVVRDLVGRLSRVQPIPVLPFRAGSEDEETLTLAELSARAQAAFPRHRIVEIRLSERGLTGVLFQLRGPGDVHALGDTIAWLHPVSGELLAERSGRTRSAGESFMHWLLPLHVGSAFGTAGLVLMCAAGIAPLLLVGTGLWVWWRKRPGERLAQERAAGRAPCLDRSAE